MTREEKKVAQDEAPKATVEQKLAEVNRRINEVVSRLLQNDPEAQRLLGQKDVLMGLQADQ